MDPVALLALTSFLVGLSDITEVARHGFWAGPAVAWTVAL